jgi:hypothetical protein
MSFWDELSSMLGYTPSQQAAQQINQARAQQAAQLQNEYQTASQDPGAGMLSPAMQQAQENELTQHIKASMSDAGAGFSGASNDAVVKGLVDYRINQMKSRHQHLDSLRTAMLNASTPQPSTAPAPQSFMSNLVGGAGQSLGRSIFGDPRMGGFGVSDPTRVPNPTGENGDVGGTPGDPRHGNRYDGSRTPAPVEGI